MAMAHPRDPVELTLTTTSTRRDGVEHFADPKLGRFDVRIPAGTPYATFGSFMLPAAFSIERPRRVEPGERDFPIIDVAIEHGEPRCVGIAGFGPVHGSIVCQGHHHVNKRTRR